MSCPNFAWASNIFRRTTMCLLSKGTFTSIPPESGERIPILCGVSHILDDPTRSMIDLLRAQTAAHHHGLEGELRIEERLSRVDTRGPLIAGYWSFYSGSEAVLRPHLWDMPGLTFSSRFRSRKAPRKSQSAGAGNSSVDPVFTTVSTKAEALGAMYVLEGSTLGGKIILKTLRAQGVSTGELHFLDPYGKDAGASWRAFLRVLERETAPDRTAMQECISGAIKAFVFAATCLREEKTN